MQRHLANENCTSQHGAPFSFARCLCMYKAEACRVYIKLQGWAWFVGDEIRHQISHCGKEVWRIFVSWAKRRRKRNAKISGRKAGVICKTFTRPIFNQYFTVMYTWEISLPVLCTHACGAELITILICPIAIAQHGTDHKITCVFLSVCLSVCLSSRLRSQFLGPFQWNFAQSFGCEN